MTFRECGKVSFPTGKLTFLKCGKRSQKTLLYVCEFHVLRPKVTGKDAIRMRIIVLFKRQFAIRAKCSFPLGETHVFRAQKTASENRAFCGSNAPRFGENVNFQKQRETGCKRLISEPRSVSFGAPQGHPPPSDFDEQCPLAALWGGGFEGTAFAGR